MKRLLRTLSGAPKKQKSEENKDEFIFKNPITDEISLTSEPSTPVRQGTPPLIHDMLINTQDSDDESEDPNNVLIWTDIPDVAPNNTPEETVYPDFKPVLDLETLETKIQLENPNDFEENLNSTDEHQKPQLKTLSPENVEQLKAQALALCEKINVLHQKIEFKNNINYSSIFDHINDLNLTMKPLLENINKASDDDFLKAVEAFATASQSLLSNEVLLNNIKQHRGMLMNTPIVRELYQIIKAICGILAAITYYPIASAVKWLQDDKTPVFEYGLCGTFFSPKTHTEQDFERIQKASNDVQREYCAATAS